MRAWRIGCLVCLTVAAAGCATTPPVRQHDLCEVFEQYPDWYDYAVGVEKTWGTPVDIQMAFVRHESGYRSNARPPREWFLFIPLGRASSARGYAQALDGTWGEYLDERGRLFRSRSHMEDALDFVGWYNHRTHQRLGISKQDAKNLYLAYHEGHTGYRRGSYGRKPKVQRTAERVERTSRQYAAQLEQCSEQFRCDGWYQVWPFCA